MHRPALFALLVVPPAFAAPVPKTVVTPVTAADLRLVKAVERRASSVRLGPAIGQLTPVDDARSVEVVDDVGFKPVTDSPTGVKPMCLAASADCRRPRCWREADRGLPEGGELAVRWGGHPQPGGQDDGRVERRLHPPLLLVADGGHRHPQPRLEQVTATLAAGVRRCSPAGCPSANSRSSPARRPSRAGSTQ